MQIKNLIVSLESPLSEALKVISREGSGVCFVVNGMRLVGIITDGDVRRSLLNGVKVDDPVESVMNTDFLSLSVNTTLAEIQKYINIYKNVPILNEAGELVDLATLSRYHQIPLVQPIFDGNELEYVTDCITTGWVSSQGKYVKQFESDFAAYVGADNALTVSNGTVALHLALVALGIGPGDEVLVPNLTFAAPANAVIYVGANPVFVDVDPISMAINPHEAEKLTSDRTRAIIAVHLYGYPANMDRIVTLATKYDLRIVEDCAEALGSCYKNRHVGLIGDCATFSFFGNKTITTGEGGMVLFKDPLLYQKAQILRDHGMSPQRRYWHTEVGFNYRLTNLQAALGVAQLEKVKDFINRKRWIADQYNEVLKTCSLLILPQDGGDIYNSYWLYTVVLKEEFSLKRDEVLNHLKAQGIEARPIFSPLNKMPPYKKYTNKDARYPISEWLASCGISLPSSVTITKEEINRVSKSLLDALV